MLKLIINADDFGYSEKINLAVIECFRNGILRSASLMANGKSFDHAFGALRSNPDLDIGVHLSLVGGMPLLGSAESHSLLKDERYFHKNAVDFAKIYFAGKISLQEVKAEWTAQIEKLLDYGIKISHIDSHQHLHILSRIFDITIELANRYKIKFIRFPREKIHPYMFSSLRLVSRVVEMATINYFCLKAEKKILGKTDFFTGFYFGGKLSKRNLLTVINYLPAEGVCELMCHPGVSYISNNYDQKQYRQIEETHALIDDEIIELIKKKNIEITSFRNL